MIFTAKYPMFINCEEFNPCELYKIDMPLEIQDKQKETAVNQALSFLIAQGIIKTSDISFE